MTYSVTIAAGKRDVVLPNGSRYQAGAVVALSDDEFGQMSATARASLLSASSYIGEAVGHIVTIAATAKNVTLPNLQRYGAGAIVTLSDAQYSTIDPAAKAALFSADISEVQIAVQSGTAPATATSGTIATAGLGASAVNPAGNITGVILQAGTQPGQQVTVINQSAFTITFAAAGTSNVADGVSDVIPATSARAYTWDSLTSLWYRAA